MNDKTCKFYLLDAGYFGIPIGILELCFGDTVKLFGNHLILSSLNIKIC